MDLTSTDGMLPAAKLPRREGMKAVEKLCRDVITNVSRPMTTASGGDAARRHQSHLDDDTPVILDSTLTTAASASASASATPAIALAPIMEWRGGPQKLDELKLRVVAKTNHFLVINKREDHRLDGDFDATIEKALHRDYPEIEKFRWIHQLDFATSGVMIIGLERDATSLACKLFREKRVQKEYLAVVRGHLSFHPRDHYGTSKNDQRPQPAGIRACALSKLGLLMKDIEDFERYRMQMKGTRIHMKHRDYPKGVRMGPSYLEMDRNALHKLHVSQSRSLTEAEDRLRTVKWNDLSPDEQRRYNALGALDKIRYLKELTAFLDAERARVAAQRQYAVPMETAAADEPVAYVFDEPIAEPSRDSFRMQIGNRNHLEDVAIAGRNSTTLAMVLGHAMYANEPVTKVLLRPLTGRRHQLRLHLAHHGFPILGDATYGSENDMAPRMMLHAWRLWLMADAKDRLTYGNLHFESPDPFEAIVPSERSLTTMTYDESTHDTQV